MNKILLEKINLFKQKNNWQGIINTFDKDVQKDGKYWDTVELVKEVGFAHSQLGNFKQALYLYQRWRELAPDRAQPYYSIGYIYAQTQDYKEAIKWYNFALEKYPSYLICLYRKGIALLQQQKNKDALKILEKTIALYRSNKNEDFQKKQRKTYIRSLFAAGKASYNCHKFIPARDLFLQVLREDKKNFISPLFKYYNLGKCFIELEEKENAGNYLEKALHINKYKDYVWERLGRFHHKLSEDYQQSLFCFEKALSCRRAPYILISRAQLYLDMGKPIYAIKDLQEALKKDRKGKHKIMLALGKVYLKQRKLTEAEIYLNRACDFKLKMYETDYAEAHYYLAYLWQMRGEKKKSEHEFTVANRIDPGLVWDTAVMNEHSFQFYDF